ncbi:biosynthetic peptidoglycan transglycosylase [Rubritalea halochordaticola]|uniref:peptidoglycan glycosyltransferase n=1 Tax=Rubritalea halochordaticola TaxID=714537 RepID=A0ABP9UXJ3_9BACT
MYDHCHIAQGLRPVEAKKRRGRQLPRLLLHGSAIGAFIALIGWYLLPFAFPYNKPALSGPAPSVLILDREGRPLHHSPREDYYRHRHSQLEGIPQTLIEATLAAEDKRFYNHGGIDVFANIRAIKDSLIAGHFVSGASTITQQTVKLTSGVPPRTLKTKFIEALTARNLEMSEDKDTILAAYFNHLDYGNRTQGPQQAALHYFNKSLNDLSLAEYALLAGLPQAPSRHNPRRNPKNALERRNWVLDRMQAIFSIPAERIERAKSEPLELIPYKTHTKAQQLSQLVLPHREEKSPHIQTTIKLEYQETARQLLQQELGLLKDKEVHHGAAVIIHNETGEILALVGTKDFSLSQINAALTPRSPGSALKPFTYLLAFENAGMSPATIVPDIPTSYAGIRGPEEVVNYDRQHHGPVTIYKALGNSLNVPAVRVLNDIGGPERLLTLLTSLGITTLDQPANTYGLGLTLGSGEVTLLEATNAFATIARLGLYTDTHITPANSVTHYKRLFSPESAYLVASVMADNNARLEGFGMHSNLHLPFPCAVKTGTSSDFRDNFCIGFTADFTVGVWVGNLDNRPMKGISGVTGAGPVFKKLMLAIHEKTEPSWLTKPASVSPVSVDPATGKRLSKGHPRYPLAIHTFSHIQYLPQQASLSDYSENGDVYLDSRYHEWMQEHPEGTYTASHTREIQEAFRVLSPARDATYLLDPDLPDHGAYLPLISNIPENTVWFSNTLRIIKHEGKLTALLTEGMHTLTATNSKTGETQTLTFQVDSL